MLSSSKRVEPTTLFPIMLALRTTGSLSRVASRSYTPSSISAKASGAATARCPNTWTLSAPSTAALGLSGSKAAPLAADSSSGSRQARAVRTMAAASTGGISVPPGQEVAVLGGGCFWCIEACYNMLKGVSSAVSGYAGGHVENPTYEQVCGKKTGHAEVVAVTFDPAVVSYKELLEVFFTIHDPTTLNRQGNDVGPAYRSIILYTDEQQKAVAEEVMAQVAADKLYSDPLVTELVPLTKFWPAEAYHQNYFANNPGQGYCRAVVAPKVAKFRSKYISKLVKA